MHGARSDTAGSEHRAGRLPASHGVVTKVAHNFMGRASQFEHVVMVDIEEREDF